jgi:hypothetical protein
MRRFRATEVVTIVVAVIAFVGTLANSFYAYSNRNRELDIELALLWQIIHAASLRRSIFDSASNVAVALRDQYRKKGSDRRRRRVTFEGSKSRIRAKTAQIIWAQSGEAVWRKDGITAGFGGIGSAR